MPLQTNLRKKVHIDITPLVDIVFLLLIFFMVSSTFLEQPGIKLELPTAKTSAPQTARELTIVVNSDNELYLNDQNIKWNQLEARLKSTLELNPSQKTLIIKADRAVPHGKVVNIMDTARTCGIKKLVVTTQLPPRK
jgi:biopolymer transport protein ExbD